MLISGDACRSYSGYCAYGGGEVGPENIPQFIRRYTKVEDISFRFYSGVTGVHEGFLEVFPTLKQIVVAETVTYIGVTPALEELLRKNDVVVRGVYDSYAEDFAQEYGLRFVHSDIEIGVERDEQHGAKTTLTLFFDREGKPFLLEDTICADSPAGGSGDSEIAESLPEGFQYTFTPESLLPYSHVCKNSILESEPLRVFLEKSKVRHD
jgi:hypothetical protein